MPSPRGALGRCIGVGAATFAAEYWDKAPLLTPAPHDGPGFDDLFTAAAADELVSRRGLRTPFARMAKDGTVLTDRSFTRSGGTGAAIADQLADDKVLGHLADGATLVLQALHRTWAPLIDFAGELTAELGHPVQINAYITPPESRGFAAHYDTHDVFVLQIAGSKKWRIHEPVINHPLPDQTSDRNRGAVADRSQEPPLLEVTLQPGDCLYLPRGYIHAAKANDDLCIHLTVGVHPITAFALLRELLTASATQSDLGRSLPIGVDLSDPDSVSVLVSEATKLLMEHLAEPDGNQLAAVRAGLMKTMDRATRPAPVAPLAQLQVIAALTPSTVLRLRSGLRITAATSQDQLVLRLLDREIHLSPSMHSALELVLTGEAFQPKLLPGIDGDDQLMLARRLLQEAIVLAVAAPVDD